MGEAPSQYLMAAAQMVVFPCTCIHYRERPTENLCSRCTLVHQISELIENTDVWMSLCLNMYEAIQTKDLEKFKGIVEAINNAIEEADQ